MQIFSNVVRGLGAALDLYHARHRVIGQNLANVETPGYRALDLDFGSALERAFDGAADDAAPPEPVVDLLSPVKIDGNSVDLELETTRLAENSLRIVALSRILARKYAGLKEAIAELR
ncbi:MAG: flagellar basal body rod protein FlgB [Thermodesulfobacteriota bacterium]